MKNIYKWYFKRLWNAIIGKEYNEAHYQYNLNNFILELIINFIDSDRSGFPDTYLEESWEKKLQSVKKLILKLNEIDEGVYDINGIDRYIKEYDKVQRKILRGIVDIFPNLWD